MVTLLTSGDMRAVAVVIDTAHPWPHGAREPVVASPAGRPVVIGPVSSPAPARG